MRNWKMDFKFCDEFLQTISLVISNIWAEYRIPKSGLQPHSQMVETTS